MIECWILYLFSRTRVHYLNIWVQTSESQSPCNRVRKTICWLLSGSRQLIEMGPIYARSARTANEVFDASTEWMRVAIPIPISIEEETPAKGGKTAIPEKSKKTGEQKHTTDGIWWLEQLLSSLWALPNSGAVDYLILNAVHSDFGGLTPAKHQRSCHACL